MGARPVVKRSMVAAVSPWGFTLIAMLSGGCAARSAVPSRNAATPGDWSAVTRLATGSVLRVEVSAGSITTGRLVSAQADHVAIAGRGSEYTFLRREVRRVVRVQRRTRMKATRGLVIGAVAGGLMGGLGTKTNQLSWAALLATGWAAVGAVIGASDGFFDREETLVYLARDVAAGAQARANGAPQPTSGVSAMR